MIARIREHMAGGDLRHLDRPESIATCLIDTGDGIAVIDPGPSSCREAFDGILHAFGASRGDVRHVVLTHIHLDHAGATGTLARENPRLRVYLHERGAPHLVDPTRLLDSARRIYGDDMDRLWGEFLPVPKDQLAALAGGERLAIGTRRWRIAATPGHAIHHIAILDEHDGVAFTGDVAGEATQHGTPALPVTPPPDIDLESWRTSLDLLLAWAPESLFLTHFGEVRRPAAHLDEMWTRLLLWSDDVRRSLDAPLTDDRRADAFLERQMERLTDGLPADRVRWIDQDSIRASWFGLARYWRKRLAPPPAA
jgi:glyoxylase-like metal-dependent hydrolase (beta-lactamase superfamily II)